MSYGSTLSLDVPFAEALTRTRKALADQGFGVLTEIDVRATLRTKLGAEMEDYIILGACNAPLAHRAIEADRSIGLLLPCNVVVRSRDGGSVVEALDPQVMSTLSSAPELASVADEASRLLATALDAIKAEAS